VPQISAVLECARRPLAGIPIIADGGIKYSGDLVKALAAAPHSVCSEISSRARKKAGETILYEGRTYKVYRGWPRFSAMSTAAATRYFQEASRI